MKDEISSVCKERHLTQEHKDKIREKGFQGKLHWFIKGYTPWNKGLTKETDNRVMESSKAISISCKGQIPYNKGKHSTQETRNKMNGRIPWNKGLTKDTDSRIMLAALKASERWKDSAYAKRMLQRRTISEPEQTFVSISDRFYLSFNFVGGGVLIIDGKNPDFVDSTGKRFIEIWGNHWHKGQDPQDRIDFFKARGYECLVIWASELNNFEHIITKVQKFIEV